MSAAVRNSRGSPGVVESDGVDDEAERSELLFLAGLVGLVQVAAPAVEDVAGEGVAGFLAVQHDQDAPAGMMSVAGSTGL